MRRNLSRSVGVGAVLLAAILATGAVAVRSQPIGKTGSRGAAVVDADGGPVRHGLTPVLRKAPKTVDMVADKTSIVTLSGERFENGANVTLTGLFYASTVGPERLSATSLEFSTAGLTEGTYSVTVHNPSGAGSNELLMTLLRK